MLVSKRLPGIGGHSLANIGPTLVWSICFYLGFWGIGDYVTTTSDGFRNPQDSINDGLLSLQLQAEIALPSYLKRGELLLKSTWVIGVEKVSCEQHLRRFQQTNPDHWWHAGQCPCLIRLGNSTTLVLTPAPPIMSSNGRLLPSAVPCLMLYMSSTHSAVSFWKLLTALMLGTLLSPNAVMMLVCPRPLLRGVMMKAENKACLTVCQSDPKPGKPFGCKMSNRAHDKLAGTIGKS